MKILLIIISILFLSLPAISAEISEAYWNAGVWEGTDITGTAADAYPGTAQAQWTFARYLNLKTIVIENTDGANSLDYKILYRVNSTGTLIDYPNETDITIVSGEAALISFAEQANNLDIYIKNTSGGNDATFKISVGGRQ